jgi:methylglyoxal synthase
MMTLKKKRTIALVARDNKKEDLVKWVRWNYKILVERSMVCTGTTGRMIEEAIKSKLGPSEDNDGFKILTLKSGPLGSGQQLRAMIARKAI